MSAAPSVWFFVSELEGERAGSFRQDRWCRVYLSKGAAISIFNIHGSFGLRAAQFTRVDDYAAFRKSVLRRAIPAASVREGFHVKVLRRVKHFTLADLYLPNIQTLLARAEVRLLASREPVVVVCSSPPFSTAVAGAALKRLHPSRVTLVVDMRDAWSMHLGLGGPKRVKSAIEGSVLRSADYITTVSYGLSREFQAQHGVSPRVLYNVATHYAGAGAPAPMDLTELDPRISRRAAKLVYTGSTPEGYYDLRAICAGAARFLREHPEEAGRVQLVFVGACQEMDAEASRDPSIRDTVICVPHVSHAKARAIQASADAVTFLAFAGNDNKGVVSTKLFEYLALGRPIFPLTVVPGSDVDRLLERYAGKSMNLLTAQSISEALHQVVAHGVGPLPSCTNQGPLAELHEEYFAFASEVLDNSRTS